MAKQSAYKQIAKFTDSWQWGRHHVGDMSEQVPPAIFSMIRRFIPEAVYTGTVYRSVDFSSQDVLQASNLNELLRKVKDYRSSNNSQYVSWSKTPDGVMEWKAYGGDDAEPIDAGEEWISLYISQETSQGIDVEALETRLVELNELENVSRASYVAEVLAPLEPPITPLEFDLTHGGAPHYEDSEGYETTKEKADNTTHWSTISGFHASEFNKLQEFLRDLVKQGGRGGRSSNRPSKFEWE